MKPLLSTLITGIVLCMLMSSCKIYAPVYKTVENVKYERIGPTGIKIGAEIVFDNPNKVKCTIKDIDVNVLLDEKLVGVLGEKSDIAIGKSAELRIPLGVQIKPEGTILDNLKTIFNIFSDKEAELFLTGKITIKFLGITVPIPVRYKKQIKLSDLKK